MFSSQENSALHKNVKYARYGIETISQEFPYGGLNREDTKDLLPEKIYQMQIFALLAYRKGLDKFIKGEGGSRDLEIMMAAFQVLKGAFCGELSQITKLEIMKKFPDANVELVTMENGNHAMLVIGRRKDSDPLNYKTWGDEAVFCDPWAKKIYSTSDFLSVRNDGDDIKHYQFIGRERVPEELHYLAGEPTILPDSQNFPEEVLSLRNKP